MEKEKVPTDKHRNRTEIHRSFSVLSVKYQWISVGKRRSSIRSQLHKCLVKNHIASESQIGQMENKFVSRYDAKE
ncbi:MAG TPA: hypothetical protein P5228_01195 [Bacteroidales bacterium]|nr:hypothetical protein [Bacteroidales bacterium]HRZ49155.1 hypothetical protein [Bacteroidales bacterium]